MKNNYSKITRVISLIALVSLSSCIKTPEKNTTSLTVDSSATHIIDLDVTKNVKVALMNDPI